MGVWKEGMKSSQQPKPKAKLQAKYINNCFFSFKIFIYSLYVCVQSWMYDCAQHACRSLWRSEEGTKAPESGVTDSSAANVGAGYWDWTLGKNSQCPNHCDISLTPIIVFHKLKQTCKFSLHPPYKIPVDAQHRKCIFQKINILFF